MKHITQKTTEQRVAFMYRFNTIVKKNELIKDDYLISFADVNYNTEFYITAKDGKKIDLIELLTKAELIAYIKLAKAWSI